MSALVMFFLPNYVYGSNRCSETDLEAINFAKAIKGRKLTGNIIKDLEVTSEISCQYECVKETRCLSYNFLSMQGKCQLSNSDRFVGHEKFTQEDGALYRGIQVKMFQTENKRFDFKYFHH